MSGCRKSQTRCASVCLGVERGLRRVLTPTRAGGDKGGMFGPITLAKEDKGTLLIGDGFGQFGDFLLRGDAGQAE